MDAKGFTKNPKFNSFKKILISLIRTSVEFWYSFCKLILTLRKLQLDNIFSVWWSSQQTFLCKSWRKVIIVQPELKSAKIRGINVNKFEREEYNKKNKCQYTFDESIERRFRIHTAEVSFNEERDILSSILLGLNDEYIERSFRFRWRCECSILWGCLFLALLSYSK